MKLARIVAAAVLCCGGAAAVAAQEPAGAGVLIDRNAGPVLQNVQSGRDIVINVNNGFDIHRMPATTGLVSGSAAADTLQARDLLQQSLRSDPAFGRFLDLFLGSSGRLHVPDALKALTEAEEGGSATAAIFLSNLYQNGSFVQKDATRARRLMERAAELGSVGAQSFLQVRLWEGNDGFAKDLAASTRYAEMLLGNDLAPSRLRGIYASALGARYATGEGAPKNACRSIALHARAAEFGNALSMRTLGIEREHFQTCLPIDKAKAAEWYGKASDAGDATSAEYAGVLAFNGQPTSRDFQLAEKHLLRANTPKANRLLGWMYLKGLPDATRRGDYSRAFAYLRRASEAGDGSAAAILGSLYEYGLGVEHNPAEAFRLYERAAHLGDSRGRLNQIIGITNGCQPIEQLVSWLPELERLASEVESSPGVQRDAQYALALTLQNGSAGAARDERRAFALLRQSCAAKVARACLRLRERAERNGNVLSDSILDLARQGEKDERQQSSSDTCRPVRALSDDPDWLF